MAFDQTLAARIRKRMGRRTGLSEKKMFGGIAFLLNGNMCCGVNGETLIARLEPGATAQALSEPHTRTFDLTGRPLKGWILVEPEGLMTEAKLGKWIQVATKYAESVPPKR